MAYCKTGKCIANALGLLQSCSKPRYILMIPIGSMEQHWKLWMNKSYECVKKNDITNKTDTAHYIVWYTLSGGYRILKM